MTNYFSNIRKVKISDTVLPQTRTWLYEAGTHNDEAFVLWAGVFKDNQEFFVTTAISPEQTSLRSPSGVGVYVDGKELFNINKKLYENDLVLFAQVHSHPSEAYHSDTDDSFPLVNAKGQFSIVVPCFAKAPEIDLAYCAIYRLSNNGIWDIVRRDKSQQIFEVL